MFSWAKTLLLKAKKQEEEEQWTEMTKKIPHLTKESLEFWLEMILIIVREFIMKHAYQLEDYLAIIFISNVI